MSTLTGSTNTDGPTGCVSDSVVGFPATGKGIFSRSGIQITGNLKTLGGTDGIAFASRWHNAMNADFALATGDRVVSAQELSRFAEEQFVESAR
jgi:hypothetical protein